MKRVAVLTLALALASLPGSAFARGIDDHATRAHGVPMADGDDEGQVGDQGDSDQKGEQGQIGLMGEQGQAGDQGQSGQSGDQGQSGEKDETGQNGDQGQSGEQDETGQKGAQQDGEFEGDN